jgi:hypothetical protein
VPPCEKGWAERFGKIVSSYAPGNNIILSAHLSSIVLCKLVHSGGHLASMAQTRSYNSSRMLASDTSALPSRACTLPSVRVGTWTLLTHCTAASL